MHSDDPPADTRKTRRPGKMDGVRAVYIAERTHHLFEEQHLSEGAVGKRTQASSDFAPHDRGSSPKPKQPAACVFPSSSQAQTALLSSHGSYSHPSNLPSIASAAPPGAGGGLLRLT